MNEKGKQQNLKNGFIANNLESECEIKLDQIPWIAMKTHVNVKKGQTKNEKEKEMHKPDLTSLCDVKNHGIEIVLLGTSTVLELRKFLERVQRGLLVFDEHELARFGRRSRHSGNGRD